MNRFRKLEYIKYNGKLEIHNSLLNVAAGADFFLADCCSQIRGDDGARASGADADVGGRRRDEVRGRRLIAGLLRGAAEGPR